MAGIESLPITVSHAAVCDPGLSVDITPSSQTVTSGDTTAWSETITVDPGNPGGVTLHCTVEWLLDGMLAGPEFVQQIAIEVPGADLSIVKTGPALVTEGDTYAYELTVTNNGPADATDVMVVDPLPGNTTFVSADAGCSEASGTVTCTIGALPAGASVSMLDHRRRRQRREHPVEHGHGLGVPVRSRPEQQHVDGRHGPQPQPDLRHGHCRGRPLASEPQVPAADAVGRERRRWRSLGDDRSRRHPGRAARRARRRPDDPRRAARARERPGGASRRAEWHR